MQQQPATQPTRLPLSTISIGSDMKRINMENHSLTLKDRKSTRLNSSHTEIYTLSLHDALPIYATTTRDPAYTTAIVDYIDWIRHEAHKYGKSFIDSQRSEEHTSELQSHRDLHSFPTRRSSDLCNNNPRPSLHDCHCRLYRLDPT